MSGLEVISAHHERAVVAVDEVILKIDTVAWHRDVELEAMRLAPVPTPRVLWTESPVLALERLPGVQLARPGEPVATSAAAWAAAGEMARELHAAPLPPWPGWGLAEFTDYVDGCSQWLIDKHVVDSVTVRRVRRLVDPALRPYPLVFTHGDLQPAHVFVDDERVVGVIDWADACQGDALFDLAVLTTGFAEELPNVLRGYGADADIDLDVIRGWWALRRLASVRWMLEHAFDASGDIAALISMA